MTEAAITKVIEDICHSGRKPWDVFEDWLDLTHAMLSALPAHAASVAAHRKYADDTPEVQALFARLRDVYSRKDFDEFGRAFAILLDTAELRRVGRSGDDSAPWDILGGVYMRLDASNSRSGQYFTPWSVLCMMAEKTLDDINAACRARVAAAINAGPWGVMGLANGESITQPGKEDIMLLALADAYAHLEPFAISDPACGSAAPLLAAATRCPQWALDYAVVRFYGQDIDRTCVKMAQINMMLYGLNGYSLKLNAALRTPRVTPVAELPPPHAIILPSARAEQGELFA